MRIKRVLALSVLTLMLAVPAMAGETEMPPGITPAPTPAYKTSQAVPDKSTDTDTDVWEDVLETVAAIFGSLLS